MDINELRKAIPELDMALHINESNLKKLEWYELYLSYVKKHSSNLHNKASDYAYDGDAEYSCCGVDITDYDIKMCPKCKEHC